jgi:paraquat-inducible protein A
MGLTDSLATTATGRDRLFGPMLILSLLLLAAGLMLPALSIGNFLFRKDYSILQGVWSFWKAGNYFLFVIVGLFSVVLPVLKTLLGAYVWFAVPRGDARAAKLVGFVAALSKWSMLDVFIIALTVLVIDGSLLTSADIHIGIIAFAAAVLLSTIGLKRMAVLMGETGGLTAADARGSPEVAPDSPPPGPAPSREKILEDRD